MVMNTAERTNVRMKALPRMLRAHLISFIPSTIDSRADAPTPTSVPIAAISVISGKVSASPEMAKGPTPCPINTRSTMLYSDATTIPTIAGTE